MVNTLERHDLILLFIYMCDFQDALEDGEVPISCRTPAYIEKQKQATIELRTHIFGDDQTNNT